MGFTFRPRHLVGALVLMIFLQLVIFFEKSREELPPHHQGEARVHRAQHAATSRGEGSPRIAIVTIQGTHHVPTNFKAYARKHGYDLIDASKSVLGAAAALRSAGGDPSFVRAFAMIRYLPQYDYVRLQFFYFFCSCWPTWNAKKVLILVFAALCYPL